MGKPAEDEEGRAASGHILPAVGASQPSVAASPSPDDALAPPMPATDFLSAQGEQEPGGSSEEVRLPEPDAEVDAGPIEEAAELDGAARRSPIGEDEDVTWDMHGWTLPGDEIIEALRQNAYQPTQRDGAVMVNSVVIPEVREFLTGLSSWGYRWRLHVGAK